MLWRTRERHHRTKQNRATSFQRAEQQHGRGNIGAVGIADHNQRVQVEIIFPGYTRNELRQLVGTLDNIFLIENTFGQPPKKSGCTIFQDFSTRAEQRSIGSDRESERKQISFVSAGTMQQEQRSLAFPWNKSINEIAHDAAAWCCN